MERIGSWGHGKGVRTKQHVQLLHGLSRVCCSASAVRRGWLAGPSIAAMCCYLALLDWQAHLLSTMPPLKAAFLGAVPHAASSVGAWEPAACVGRGDARKIDKRRQRHLPTVSKAPHRRPAAAAIGHPAGKNNAEPYLFQAALPCSASCLVVAGASGAPAIVGNGGGRGHEGT